MHVPSFSLEGKVAIVTGGKSGIGRAVALTFAGAGADVAVCSRTEGNGELSGVAKEIKKLGRRSLAIQADVSRKADVDNLVQRVVAELGSVDILVNCAGNLISAPIFELSEEGWDATMNTHLKGCFLCSQAAAKVMAERKRGNIINISSISAWKAYLGGSAYCTAKAGIITLTKVLAMELGAYNIRVNAIAPGWVRTSMIDYLVNDTVALQKETSETPLGRIAEPREMASVALFLASEASSFVTGYTILADGGNYTG